MSGMSLTAFAAGVGVGLTVAVPIGPMGILCIQRTLAFGLVAGLVTGLGAATVHLAVGSMAALGLGAALSAWAGASAPLVSLLSAGLLFWFAARILSRTVVLGGDNPKPEGWLQLYGSTLLFGVSNPLLIMLFMATLPTLTARSNQEAAPLLIAGVFLGSITWWIVLSSTVSLLRARLSAGGIALMNKAAGLTLAALGAATVANAFGLGLR